MKNPFKLENWYQLIPFLKLKNNINLISKIISLLFY